MNAIKVESTPTDDQMFHSLAVTKLFSQAIEFQFVYYLKSSSWIGFYNIPIFLNHNIMTVSLNKAGIKNNISLIFLKSQNRLIIYIRAFFTVHV